jgi:hypothetical protein
VPLIAGTRPAVLIFTGSVRPALPRAAVSSSAPGAAIAMGGNRLPTPR